MSTSAAFGAVGELAASRHGVISSTQAAAFGVNARSLLRFSQRGLLHPAGAGVYVVAGSPPTWHQRTLVAVLSAGSGAVAAGDTACRLHRLDGAVFESIEVLVPHASHHHVPVRSEPPQFSVRRSRSPVPFVSSVEIDGIPALNLAAAITDAAGNGRIPIERLVDDFERRGRSLTWLRMIAESMRAKGRIGPGAVLQDLDRRALARTVRGSWFEKLVEDCCRRVPGVVRQHEVCDESGSVVARLDLAVPRVRLGIEAHSREFHTGLAREAADERRDNRLARLGWEVLYVGFDDVRRPSVVAALISDVVVRRADDLRPAA